MKTEDQYSISYKLNNICIKVVYPSNSQESDVDIHFFDKNQVFSVGWIALVRKNIIGSDNKLINVKELLKYIEDEYSQITNYKFCKDSVMSMLRNIIINLKTLF